MSPNSSAQGIAKRIKSPTNQSKRIPKGREDGHCHGIQDKNLTFLQALLVGGLFEEGGWGSLSLTLWLDGAPEAMQLELFAIKLSVL